MDTLEVYALNIQPSQLKQATSQYNPTQENLEETRKEFLSWLRERRKFLRESAEMAGFTDQMSAWDAFIKFIDYDSFDEEDIEVEISWMLDIENILESKIRPANYEQRSKHGFPSQM